MAQRERCIRLRWANLQAKGKKKTKDVESCSSQRVFGDGGGSRRLGRMNPPFPCSILEIKMSPLFLGGASTPPDCWLNLVH